MEYMPEELLNEIMLELPMKTVARWKCVCKSWYSFLSSFDFITQYLQLSNNKMKHNNDHDLILNYDDYNLNLISIFSHESLRVVDTYKLTTYTPSAETYIDRIVGCCNGIVCVAAGFDSILLWNPKTKQVKVLPRTLYGSRSRPISRYVNHVGFGYDDYKNDYKVVSIWGYPSSEDYKAMDYDIEVYSLKLDSWRVVRSNVKYSDFYVNSLVGTCADWMCSWLVLHRGSEAALSFEMGKEIIILTPFPSPEKRFPTEECYMPREEVDLVDLNGQRKAIGILGVGGLGVCKFVLRRCLASEEA